MHERNSNEALREVCSQVATEVNNLYEYFRKKQGLEEETDTLRQIEVLVSKKYISHTYLVNLESMVRLYETGRISQYLSDLEEYKIRINYFLNLYS